MARPARKGLVYFPRDTDYYDDFKIVDLMYEYGPLGNTVYDVILTVVYKNGYYVELPIEKMVHLVIRTIGNRWATKEDVTKVILYCGNAGLLDESLLLQNVFTSVGIQRRYSEITARNKVDKSMYWLLDESGKPLAKDTKTCIIDKKNEVFVAETTVLSAETDVFTDEMQQNKIKENKIKENNTQCYDAPAARCVKSFALCYDNIVSSFNEICKDLPKVRDITEKRKKAMRAAAPRVESYGGWDKLFKAIQHSDFLTGRNGAWTNCGFDWILIPSNLTKIMEGNYRNKDEASDQPPASYDIDEMERRLIHGEIKYERRGVS